MDKKTAIYRKFMQFREFGDSDLEHRRKVRDLDNNTKISLHAHC